MWSVNLWEDSTYFHNYSYICMENKGAIYYKPHQHFLCQCLNLVYKIKNLNGQWFAIAITREHCVYYTETARGFLWGITWFGEFYIIWGDWDWQGEDSWRVAIQINNHQQPWTTGPGKLLNFDNQLVFMRLSGRVHLTVCLWDKASA